MNFHSSSGGKSVSLRLKALKIANVNASSFMSEELGTLVTYVSCGKCAKVYQDILLEARKKILDDVPLLCLQCDPNATRCSRTVLTDKGFTEIGGGAGNG